METHANDANYSCKTCQLQFKSNISLKHHMEMHANDKVFSCNTYELQFKSSTALKLHMETHTNDGDWTCDECSYQTNSEEYLKTHSALTKHDSHKLNYAKQNYSSTQYSCNFCDNKFQTNEDMMDHRRKSHKTFKPCKNIPDCNFQDQCLFNHKPINSNTFLCYECGEELRTLSDLMFHRKKQSYNEQMFEIHEERMPFQQL